MGYVRMPEMLSPELIKTLAGNFYTVKEAQSPEDEMAAAWKEYFKDDKKCDKKDDKKEAKKHGKNDVDICCPKKVKFIFVLNNAVVINVNAIAEGEEEWC